MGEVRSAFVELEEARDAVIGEIFCDAGFGNAEMIREAGVDGLGTAATGGTAQQGDNGGAQRRTRFDIIVWGKIGIAQKKHAGADGSTNRLPQHAWGAG